MSMPLLTTKLYIPPLRPDPSTELRTSLVRRSHLVQQLDEGLRLGRKLSLISAPAGFGKTTLLSEWLSQLAIDNYQLTIDNYRVAWLSLDEDDNDPARFLAYFTAALRQVEENIGKEAPGALPQPLSTEAILTTLINQINALSPMLSTHPAVAEDGFVLVLDDYHVIKAQPIHSALTFLLDHMPPQMHLVIASRADPPLPVARLRGQGQLTELRLTDLRFTPGEAAEFLNRIMGLDLSTEDVAVLTSRTEGWIAGLQMAALSMQGQDDLTGFIRAFTGSNRYILDYLVEEILQRQPEHIQTFLFQTAILDRLTASLCDAVLETRVIPDGSLGRLETSGQDQPPREASNLQSPSQQILEQLEAANLFIIPLDNERHWYRYHRLFADLLRKRLHQAYPDQVPALHRRASAWYEQRAVSLGENGLMAEAIDHAMSAKDFGRAADLIEQNAEATLMRSEVITFLGWVEALPDELVQARPFLGPFHAWALLLAGRPLEVVESCLQGIDESADLVPSKVAPLRAIIAIYQGQVSRAVELSRQALEQLPEEDAFSRNVATWILTLTQVLNGDVVTSRQALEGVFKVSLEIGNVMIAVGALSRIARLHVRQGKLHEAKAIYQRALELATDKQGRPLPVASKAMMGLGDLWREWNDLEAATRHLTQGIELARQWGEIAALDSYITLARVKQAQGDVDGAQDAIQKAQQIALKFDAAEWDDLFVAMYQARLWIAQGDIEAATRWAQERELEAGISLVESGEGEDLLNYHLRRYEHATLARLLIAQEQPDEALGLLEQLLPVMERRGRKESVIEIHILKALAFQVQADAGQALVALERALSLAEPGGYVRIFVDEGRPMARLLQAAVSRGIVPEYAGRLLATFETETKNGRQKTRPAPSSLVPGPFNIPFGDRASSSSPALSEAEGLVEPLSDRELEVLRLLATHLSSTEISEELFISVNTVRSHIKNIYGKLDVHSRYEAIARAQELGLL